MNNHRNYYRILHVQPDAPLEIIKSSYRTIMLKLNQHPDRGGDHGNAALINEAYRVLTDPIKRARYDLACKHRAPGRDRSNGPAQRRSQDKAGGESCSYDRSETALKGVCAFCMTPHPIELRNEPHADCPLCRSPLYEAQRLQRCGSSKRSIARVKHDDEMDFYTCWPQKRAYRAKMRDLSPHGLQFLSRKPLAENQVIKIVSDGLHATARIACCFVQNDVTGCYHRIGAEFITLRFNHSRGTFVSAQV